MTPPPWPNMTDEELAGALSALSRVHAMAEKHASGALELIEDCLRAANAELFLRERRTRKARRA